MTNQANDNTETAAPTLAELNRHLFASILPGTHAAPEVEADQADDEPKKPAGKGKAAAKTNEE